MPSRSQIYRKKLRESDPEAYQRYLAKQRERCQRSRDEKKHRLKGEPLTLAQLEINEAKRMKKNEQMRANYYKKKAETERKTRRRSSNPGPIETLKTKRPRDMDEEEKRAYRTAMRRRQRDARSSQKKTAEETTPRISSEKRGEDPFGEAEEAASKVLDQTLKSLPKPKVRHDEALGDRLNVATLICFGGGFTSGFAKALGDCGLAKLKTFVHNGGRYLGFGAGGYLGCDYIEFDVGGPFEKLCERDIRLYPGIGRGPVYPGFEYGTNRGVNAAPVTFNSPFFNGTFHAFIDGGGAFIPSDTPKLGSEVTKVTLLAKFNGLDDDPTAIVATDIGGHGGKAVLSGVHLEYDTIRVVNSETDLANLHDHFHNSKESQDEAFKSLLMLLGLDAI